jgi:hypothetical protein
VQLENFQALSPFFSPKSLSALQFNITDGSTLPVGEPSHITGTLTFSHKLSPVSVYSLPTSALSQSLFGVSHLIRPNGFAVFTNTSSNVSAISLQPYPFSQAPSPSMPTSGPYPYQLLPLSSLFIPSALFTLQALLRVRFVSYWNRAFGSPSLSTFLKALQANFIRNIPALTPSSLIRKFPPLALATVFGHLNNLRRGIASTRLKLSPSAVALALPLAPRQSVRLVAHISSLRPKSSRSFETNGQRPISQVGSLSRLTRDTNIFSSLRTMGTFAMYPSNRAHLPPTSTFMPSALPSQPSLPPSLTL